MRAKKPRLINYKPVGVPCAKCKYALPVDAKHNRYYCVKPEERYWVYYGGHVCGKGENE